MMEQFTNFLSPAQIDPEKIIEYPGFTVPPPEGVKDVSDIFIVVNILHVMVGSCARHFGFNLIHC